MTGNTDQCSHTAHELCKFHQNLVVSSLISSKFGSFQFHQNLVVSSLIYLIIIIPHCSCWHQDFNDVLCLLIIAIFAEKFCIQLRNLTVLITEVVYYLLCVTTIITDIDFTLHPVY